MFTPAAAATPRTVTRARPCASICSIAAWTSRPRGSVGGGDGCFIRLFETDVDKLRAVRQRANTRLKLLFQVGGGGDAGSKALLGRDRARSGRCGARVRARPR